LGRHLTRYRPSGQDLSTCQNFGENPAITPTIDWYRRGIILAVPYIDDKRAALVPRLSGDFTAFTPKVSPPY
jgi:hypothetical protein